MNIYRNLTTGRLVTLARNTHLRDMGGIWETDYFTHSTKRAKGDLEKGYKLVAHSPRVTR